MKKLFLVALALIGFNAATHAQGAHLGFKAGLNFADFNGGDLNTDSRIGFHVGLVAELRLSDKFAIQPEAIYSSQGIELNTEDLAIDYLNIPVLADIKLFKAVSLQVGPQFGFKINEDEVESIADVKDLDIGAAAGVEVKILKFFVQARYNFGLTDVIDTANAPKNAVFQLSVGFNFF